MTGDDVFHDNDDLEFDGEELDEEFIIDDWDLEADDSEFLLDTLERYALGEGID